MGSGERLVAGIDVAERRRRPPPSAPAMEEMRADGGRHHQLPVPCRRYRIGVVVRRQSDLRHHAARQCRRGDLFGARPIEARRHARHRPVAGERELAPGRSFRPLIDHAADGVREGGMADAVEDDLRHRLLAGIGFAGRFVIDRRRQALQRPRPVRCAGHSHREGPGGNYRAGQAPRLGTAVTDLCRHVGRDRQIGQLRGAGHAGGRRRLRIGDIEFLRPGEMILGLVSGGRRWRRDDFGRVFRHRAPRTVAEHADRQHQPQDDQPCRRDRPAQLASPRRPPARRWGQGRAGTRPEPRQRHPDRWSRIDNALPAQTRCLVRPSAGL